MNFLEYCKQNDRMSFIECWSDENTFLPQDISYGSHKEVLFKCKTCGTTDKKIIHSIRKNSKYICKECNKREQEKKRREMEEKQKIKKSSQKKEPKPPNPKKKTKKEIAEEMKTLPIDKRFLVLDVETNGVNSKDFDLLEIAIYRPDTNTMFHKLLPLTKQNDVLTTRFNGLTKEMLKDATHLTEEDIEILINEFEIDKRTLLHYGTLDAPFIKQYMKEHNLPKRSTLKFYNFKKQIISSRFAANEIDGGISKDNLCNMYRINGVQSVHDCQNDCILEWKLFEKMYNKILLITGVHVYSVPDNCNYLVPSSFLDYSRIEQILKNPLPNISVDDKYISHFILGNCLPKIRKHFGPQAVGMIIEHEINILLDVQKYNNQKLFTENKQKLNYEGSLVCSTPPIPAEFKSDGSICLIENKFTPTKKLVKLQKILDKEIPELRESLKSLIDKLKKTIFLNNQIYSQEVVINNKDGVIAQCDLSSVNAVCEIKNTNNSIDYYKYQLWYQQNSEQIESAQEKSNLKRDLYVIKISNDEKRSNVSIAKINFIVYDTKQEADRASYFKRIN